MLEIRSVGKWLTSAPAAPGSAGAIDDYSAIPVWATRTERGKTEPVYFVHRVPLMFVVGTEYGRSNEHRPPNFLSGFF